MNRNDDLSCVKSEKSVGHFVAERGLDDPKIPEQLVQTFYKIRTMSDGAK